MYATWHSHLLCCTKITTERKVTKLQNYIVNIHAATLFHSLKLCNYDTLVATIIYQPIDCFYGWAEFDIDSAAVSCWVAHGKIHGALGAGGGTHLSPVGSLGLWVQGSGLGPVDATLTGTSAAGPTGVLRSATPRRRTDADTAASTFATDATTSTSSATATSSPVVACAPLFIVVDLQYCSAAIASLQLVRNQLELGDRVWCGVLVLKQWRIVGLATYRHLDSWLVNICEWIDEIGPAICVFELEMDWITACICIKLEANGVNICDLHSYT